MINEWKWINRLKGAIFFRFMNYILVGLMGMFIAYIFSNLTDKFISSDYHHIEVVFFQIIIVVLISCFFIPVLQYKEANLMEKQGGEADIIFFNDFLKQKNYFIPEKDYGMYMNILWGDFPVYRMNLIFIVSYFMAGTITVLVSVGLIAYYHIGFAILAIIISVLIVIIPLLFQGKLEKKNEEKLYSKDQVTENMKNIFSNVEYIRLEKQNVIVDYILRPLQNKLAEAFTAYEKLSAKLSYAIRAVLLSIEILIYAAGCYLISSGNINFAIFVKVVLMISVTKNGVNWLIEGVQSIHDIKNSKKRIENILVKSSNNQGVKLDCIHNIVLHGVNFEYSESNTKIEYPDMVLENKKVYRIAGKNGAGKSTLLKILTKIYKNYDGEILINDSQKINNIDESYWYKLVTLIPQKPLLFHMSIKDNIILGNKDIDWNLYETLLCDFKLKEIENKNVEFGGEGISGGEAQSISIVRALLRKPQVILADEPYNTLDLDRKHSLEKYIDMMDSKMFIIVSHQEFHINREISVLEVNP